MQHISGVLEKLEKVVDSEMQVVLGAQKTRLPILLSADSWRKTGRWDQTGDELFRLKDRRDNDFCLGPTHEETVTDLVASFGHLSHKQLPIKLYQITQKYRDEIRPRFGLMRGREFTMKDMYSFHADEEDIMRFYDNVCTSYENILKKLGLDFVKVRADTGNIGGNFSHEYHILADTGEDDLVCCDSGDYAANVELFEPEAKTSTDVFNLDCNCTESTCSCMGKGKLRIKKGIEVGHCFILGTKYSDTLKAIGVNADQKRFPLIMGCYGLGLSRLIAASVESYRYHASTTKVTADDAIVWPRAIAPYEMIIMTAPGKESERQKRKDIVEKDIVPYLSETVDINEVVLDDRWKESLGVKMAEAKLIGYIWVVLVGKKGIEVHHLPSSNIFSVQHASEIPSIISQFDDRIQK